MEHCKHADAYRAIRKPTCGCDECKRKYVRTRLTNILHGEFYDDMTRIKLEAMNALDVLG